MRKYWMLGLFGGLALTFPGYGGDVKTSDKFGDVDITIGGQVRTRYDYRDNLTYTQGAVHASDDRTLLRSRLNVAVKAKDGIEAFVQFQDSHQNGAATSNNMTGAPGSTADANLVMRQGYLKVSDLFGLPMDLTVGRVALHYGNGRVINDLDWSNSPRHFDGALLKYHVDNDATWVDIGWLEHQNRNANVASLTTPPEQRSDDDYDIFLLYGHHELNDNTTLEAYNVWERDGLADRLGEKSGVGGFTIQPEKLNRHTSGALVQHKMDNMNVSFEYIHQWGENGRDNVNAHAYALVLGYSLKDSMDTKFEYELTSATGDGDPTDGDAERFQSPFHFNHKYQGWADVVGFTNMTDHKLQVASNIDDKNRIIAAWHFFDRNESSDSWYDAGGNVLFTGKGSNAAAFEDGFSGSSDIGQELDLLLKHDYSKNLKIELGYSHFMPGTLPRDSDSSLGAMDFGWLQFKLDF